MLVPTKLVFVPANLVVCEDGNAFDVIFDVLLVNWNRLEFDVATSSEEFDDAKAFDVIFDVALVC